jgi:hypothetical protein
VVEDRMMKKVLQIEDIGLVKEELLAFEVENIELVKEELLAIEVEDSY